MQALFERLKKIRFVQEPVILATLVIIATLLWGFVELADEIIEKEPFGFDEKIIFALRDSTDLANPWGPFWIEEAMRDVSALGSMMVVSLFTFSLIGVLCLRRKFRLALFVFTAVVGALLLNVALKSFFMRPRPDVVVHLSLTQLSSFPSGHSMLAATVYFTLAAIFSQLFSQRLVRLYIFFLAFTVVFLVGFSRVYLGVHWPSDVLAGWAVGASWALLCWIIEWMLGRRVTKTEPEKS